MAGGYDGTVKIDTTLDSSGFNKGMKGMNAGVGGLMNSLKGLAATVGLAFGVAAIVGFAKASIDAAANVEEMSSKFAIVFKDMAGAVEKELASFAKATNGSKYELMGFAAMMQDTFVPLGFARDKAAEMSVQVVKLATDLGSFNNLPTAQVVADIQSALVGNTETMRKYGVVASQVRIEEEAQAMGLWDGAGAIDANAKAAAILSLIMKGNADAMGDATRTAGSYTNQMRGIAAAFTDLKVAVGQSLITLIAPVLPYIKAAIQMLAEFFAQIAQLVALLFGIQVQTAGTAGGMSDTADAADDAAKNTDKLGEKTKKAKKEAQGALAAFDEINVLAKKTAEGGDTGTTGGAPTIPMPKIETKGAVQKALDDISAQLQEWKDKIIALFKPALDAFGRLRDALAPLGKTIWEGLKWAWDNILVPLGAWTISTLLPAFLDLLAAGATLLNQVLIALKPAAVWLWENFLQPIAAWTGGAIILAIQTLTDIFKIWGMILSGDFAGAWALWQERAAIVWEWLLQTWGGVAEWFMNTIVSPVIGIFVMLWQGVGALAQTAWDGIAAVWSSLAGWFYDNVITPISGAFAPLWEMVGILANDAYVVLVAIWGAVVEWFRTNVTDPLAVLFTEIWQSIGASAQQAWDAIAAVFSGLATWFEANVISPLRNSFSGVGDGLKTAFGDALEFVRLQWEQTFTGIFDFVKGMINGLIDLINGMLSGFAEGFNGIIATLNTAGAVIPGWTEIPEVSAPQIPRLAKGGVIPANSQFLAVMGDQRAGTNIEAPEALIRQIVSEEIGNMQANIQISFAGDLAALVRELKPYVDRENVRVGGSLVKSGVTV